MHGSRYPLLTVLLSVVLSGSALLARAFHWSNSAMLTLRSVAMLVLVAAQAVANPVPNIFSPNAAGEKYAVLVAGSQSTFRENC